MTTAAVAADQLMAAGGGEVLKTAEMAGAVISVTALRAVEAKSFDGDGTRTAHIGTATVIAGDREGEEVEFWVPERHAATIERLLAQHPSVEGIWAKDVVIGGTEYRGWCFLAPDTSVTMRMDGKTVARLSEDTKKVLAAGKHPAGK